MSARTIDWSARLAAEKQLARAVAVLAANPNPCRPDVRVSERDRRALCDRHNRPLTEISLDVAARLLIDYLVAERARTLREWDQKIFVRPMLRVIFGGRR